MNTMKSSGKKEIKAYFLKTLKINALKIFNKVCPASILAKSRTERLNGLIKQETISMITKNGISGLGTPLGTNKFKNSNLLFIILISVIPKNNENAI